MCTASTIKPPPNAGPIFLRAGSSPEGTTFCGPSEFGSLRVWHASGFIRDRWTSLEIFVVSAAETVHSGANDETGGQTFQGNRETDMGGLLRGLFREARGAPARDRPR